MQCVDGGHEWQCSRLTTCTAAASLTQLSPLRCLPSHLWLALGGSSAVYRRWSRMAMQSADHVHGSCSTDIVVTAPLPAIKFVAGFGRQYCTALSLAVTV